MRLKSSGIVKALIVIAIAITVTVIAQPFTANAQDKPVTITYWELNVPPYVAYIKRRIVRFEANNPDVKVDFFGEIPPTGAGGYQVKLITAVATRTAPDVFDVFDSDAKKYLQTGQLAPIDAAAVKALGFESLADFKAHWAPGILDSWTDDDGTMYGVPRDGSYFTLYCNNDHFQAAGVDPAAVTFKTWADLIDVGKRVIAGNEDFYKDSSGNFIRNFIKMAFYQDDGWSMQVLTSFLAQTGGSVLSEDGKSAAINSPKGVQAVQAMMDVSRGLGDPNIGPTGPGPIFGDFSSEEMTCAIAGEWLYGIFLKNRNSPLADHFTAYPLPQVTADRFGNIVWGRAFVVNARSEHKDAAFRMIGDVLIGDPNSMVSEVGNWPPVAQDLPAIQDVPFHEIVLSNRRGLQRNFQSPKFPEIATLLRGALESLAFEGGPVAPALNEAAEQINKILARP